MGMTRKGGAGRKGASSAKFTCDQCTADVTSTVRIHCNVCSDVDLCVPCFAEGKTGDTPASENHDPQSHAFKVIEQHSIPIFTEDWGADEELALIAGAETYGLGSWADIADHVGGFREKEEVRDHYISTYVNTSRFPLPEAAALDDVELSESIPREEFQARKKRRIEERKEAQANAPPIESKQKPTASQPSCHEVQGFMPGRLEFETEYFNEAEEAVQHMSFEPGDGLNPRTGEIEPEMELKLKIMEIYNSRLTHRVERKRVIFEHELLEFKRNQGFEKKRSKDEKDLYHRVKPFARMMQHKDFVEFNNGLAEELNLRTAIRQLQEWRQMQIDTLSQGEKYEQEKQQRIQRNVPTGQFDRLASSRISYTKSNPQSDPPGIAAQLVAPELPEKYLPHAFTPPGSQSPPNKAAINGNGHVNGILTPQSNPEFVIQPVPNCAPIDLYYENDVADRYLLSPSEEKLCSMLRLFPKPYMKIKQHILNEAMKAGGSLKKKQVREMCGLENTKGNRIFEFFYHNGWIGKA